MPAASVDFDLLRAAQFEKRHRKIRKRAGDKPRPCA
jgi:hypothetical protein